MTKLDMAINTPSPQLQQSVVFICDNLCDKGEGTGQIRAAKNAPPSVPHVVVLGVAARSRELPQGSDAGRGGPPRRPSHGFQANCDQSK